MSPVAVPGTPHRPIPSKVNGGLGPNPRLRELAFPQLPSEHFSDERLRKIGGELDGLRDLEGREAFFTERDDLVLRRVRASLQDDEGFDGLAAIRVRNPDRRRLRDRRVHEQDLLNLSRIDVVAGTQDQVLLAVYDGEISVLVHLRDVAGQEPSVLQDRRRLLRLVPISLHHLRTPDRELADLARRDLAGCIFRVHELRVRVGERDPDAFLHDPIDRVAVRDRGRFREAIAFDDSSAGRGLELLPHLVRERCRAGNAHAHWTAFATRFRWVSIAPFGVPVVPPVYCKTATSSGSAGVCVESARVFARSANRWIHGSRGIERGQWPAFWRSFFFLIGYSCRSGVLRNSVASQTTTLWTWVPAFALERLCQNRSRATTVSTPASFHRASSSRGVRIGFVWTTIAPARRTAKNATMKCGVFGRRRDTRSPA